MNKNYRKNVAAVVLSQAYPERCEVLVALRTDMKVWQFPQGGIDDGETPRQALFRELREELGCDCFSVVAEYPEWLSYDFPSEAVKKKYKFDGQIQRYFLVKIAANSAVNIHTKEPEFRDFAFVPYKELNPYINHFKKPIYSKVLRYFQKEGYLG